MKNSDKKPALVFIHGFRGNHLGLKKTIEYLKNAGYTCYAPDIPPAFNTTGEKLPALSDFSADGYAKFIANYILDNNIEHPILIGHSMGSIICAATAEKYPELCNDKIFFLSPICVKPPKFICHLAPLVTIFPNRFIGYITTKYLIVPKDKKTLQDVLEQTYKCAEHFTSYKDTGQAARFSIKYSISDFTFKKNAYFIAGEKDRLNSQRAVRETAKKYDGHVSFLAKSGHLINYEVPEILAREILAGIES